MYAVVKGWGKFQEDTEENTKPRTIKLEVEHYRTEKDGKIVLEYESYWWETLSLKFIERFFTYETWLSSAELAAKHPVSPKLVNHYSVRVREDGSVVLTLCHNLDTTSPRTFHQNVIEKLWKRWFEEYGQYKEDMDGIDCDKR